MVIRRYDEGFRVDLDPLGLNSLRLAEGYRNRGVVKGRLGDHEGALADFNKAVTLYPPLARGDRALAYTNLGNIKLLLEDYEGALEAGRAAKRLSRRLTGVDVLLIAASLHLGDYETVLSSLDDAINGALGAGSSVNLGPTFGVRGLVRSLAGDERGAMADVEEAVRRPPDAAEVRLVRSVVKFFLRDYGAAVADADEALRLAGGRNKQILENMAYSARARAKVFSGDPEGASADFAEAARRASAVIHSPAGFGMLAFLPINARVGQHQRSYAGALIYLFHGTGRWSAGHAVRTREAFEKAREIAVKVANGTLERLSEDGLARLSAKPSG